MALEVTPEQYSNLNKFLKMVEKRRNSEPKRITPEKEMEVVEYVKEGLSSYVICEVTGVCRWSIETIKKKYGLWGV